MTDDLPVLELLRKPSVEGNLDRVKEMLEQIMEQTQLAKAFPVALLDSQKLESIILSIVEANAQALKETLRSFEQMQHSDDQKLTRVAKLIEQKISQDAKIMELLLKIYKNSQIKAENAELERAVLQKLNRELGG